MPPNMRRQSQTDRKSDTLTRTAVTIRVAYDSKMGMNPQYCGGGGGEMPKVFIIATATQTHSSFTVGSNGDSFKLLVPVYILY